MNQKNLLSHKEAAGVLGVSVHRIAKWLDKGMIPYVQIGQVRKIDKDALLEWYRNQIVYPDNNGEPAPQQSKTDEGS